MNRSVMKKVLSFVLLILFLSVSSIVLADPNNLPVSDPNGPYTGTVGTPVQFDGSASNDPSGSPLTYDWDFGDGNAGSGVRPTHTYAADGTYTVTLTVSNDFGDAASATTTAEISGNQPPVSDPNGPYTGTVGTPVQFDGSASNDPDGTIVAYDWDFGDGNIGSGMSPTHTYAADGTYTVALTVTDDAGLTNTATTTAEISGNQPPVSDPNGPYTGTVGTPVQFDGSASVDPDGTIIAYDWDFGDGNIGSGMSPTHTYAADGTYTVALTVTDDAGLSDTATTTATISEQNQQSEDTCKESNAGDINTRNDVDILSASYDSASDAIEVCVTLCDDECMPKSQYRFHFDYDEDNGMASYLEPEDRDEGSCKISIIGNNTGTTSDDTVRFVCSNDGINPQKITGPTEGCTAVNVEGEFCCTVLLSELVREDGSMVEECDAVDIWIDTQRKGKQDRAPDTDGSDGCSKPTGINEVLLFTTDSTAPEITCSDDETIECDEQVDIDDPVITDQCDSDPTITAISGIWPGNCIGEWETSEVWTVTDAAGNSNSCGTTVYQEDTTPPDMTCEGITVQATSPEGAEVDLSLLVDAPDNCSTAQITCDTESGLFPIGSTDVTCTATDECGNTSSCEFSVIVVGNPAIDFEKYTNGEDADNSPGPSINVGEQVEWEYVVTNVGDVPLVDVEVTDDKLGLVCIYPTLLAVGESFSCTYAGEAELGPYENIGTVTGTAPSGTVVEDEDPSHYVGVEDPAIDLEKSTNGEDADNFPGPSINVGEQVVWEYVVTNTGDVPLANVVVTDDQLGLVCIYPTLLAVGESFSCNFFDIATLGPYENVGTVTGTSPSGTDVQDDDLSHYVGVEDPAIDLEKSTNGEDADNSPGPSINVGEQVVWEYVVTNTGDVPLANVVVTDDQLGLVCIYPTLLAVGESFSCNFFDIATLGPYENVGTVTGTSPSGTVVEDADPSHYVGVEDPAIDLEKSTNGEDADNSPGPSINVGEQVVWEYVVTNTGDVPLANIEVTDDKLGPVCSWPTLAVGESISCNFFDIATLGPYENVSTVTGTSPSGTVVEDADPSHYVGVGIAVGACCPDVPGVLPLECTEVSESDCLIQGNGEYQGDGTTCDQVECLDPNLVGCCFPDGSCAEELLQSCINQGGEPLDPGFNCNQVICGDDDV